MSPAFTPWVDATVICYIAFTLFFVGLCIYLHREDKREGYPLVAEFENVRHPIVGFPNMPAPKVYRLMDGGTVSLPNHHPEPAIKAAFRKRWRGSPLYPVGEPLLAGIGPGAYTLRSEEPFRMVDGSPQLQPLRCATDYSCVDADMDPRGRRVFGDDMKEAGVVVDLWVDKGSAILRYIEVALDGDAVPRLIPIFYASVRRNERYLRVTCMKAAQLRLAPVLAKSDIVTPREEDRINGFFAGGALYAVPLKDALL